MVNRWARLLADTLFPQQCLLCRLPSASHLPLCACCAAQLAPNLPCCQRCALPLPMAEPARLCGRCLRRPPPQCSAQAVFLYADPIDRLLARLKFSADLAAGAGLATHLAERAKAIDATKFDRLLPLPLHPRRERERGYNQVSELLRGCPPAWKRRLRADLLQRTAYRGPQSDLSAGQRRRNVRGTFAAAPSVAGQRVLLVDDVITTGSTMSEATRCLLAAGATEVHWLALARAPSRK